MDSPMMSRQTQRQAGAPQFVGFVLDEQRYAFRIERIQEIVNPSAVTRLPEVPAFVEGVRNLRGTIIPIVTLRLLFGLPARPTDGDTRTIVVNVGQRTLGCTVDAVLQVIRIPADQILPPPDTLTASGPRYVEGLAKVGDDLFILLDTAQLLDPANLEAVHQVGLVMPPTGDS